MITHIDDFLHRVVHPIYSHFPGGRQYKHKNDDLRVYTPNFLESF